MKFGECMIIAPKKREAAGKGTKEALQGGKAPL
jgi:hypothetical protein